MSVLERNHDSIGRQDREPFKRIGSKARLALFAVCNDRRTRLLKAPQGIAHGILVSSLQRFAGNIACCICFHCPEQFWRPWNTADWFSRNCHESQSIHGRTQTPSIERWRIRDGADYFVIAISSPISP